MKSCQADRSLETGSKRELGGRTSRSEAMDGRGRRSAASKQPQEEQEDVEDVEEDARRERDHLLASGAP